MFNDCYSIAMQSASIHTYSFNFSSEEKRCQELTCIFC
jgi:hypothetical protein